MDEATRERIQKVVGQFECSHDLKCFEDGGFCQTSQLGKTGRLQCDSSENEGCSFAVSFAGGKLCTCPLQKFFKEHNIRQRSLDSPQAPASEESPEPAGEESPSPGQNDPTAYRCYRCNTAFSSIEEMKFCTKCGAPVNPVRSSASKRVLVIDDSHVARKKLTAILKKLSCQVVEAEDGSKGVAAALEENPDLIVLDVQMPIMNGLQALTALRQNSQFDSTPILMMTLEADARMVSQPLAAGAKDYIRKDSSIAELLSRLGEHISRLG
ncbi:response regulator [Candidatus Bathyarchaeota archaeon]|jgi:CheY-like chemotaxis protein|nr:response regulator [Candidatus Bathyarchaeota archaeon]